MILSKRERLIAIGMIIAVVGLLLDGYVLTPFMERRSQLDAERESLDADLTRARDVFRLKRKLGVKWKEMRAAGLTARPAEAETRVLHALRDWSQGSGLVLTALKPVGKAEKHGLEEMTFQAAGTGPMRAVVGFLYRLQTASLPLKVTELKIGARKAGRDDLSLQLQVSALASAAPAPGADASAGGKANGKTSGKASGKAKAKAARREPK